MVRCILKDYMVRSDSHLCDELLGDDAMLQQF